MKLFTPATASHWYYPDGTACHQVPMKTKPGEFRDTTVGDARKLGLYPSSTNIIKVIEKPELMAWRGSQVVLAALTLPRNPLEGDDDFAARVVRDSQEQVSEAASIGTKLHKAIEDFLCLGIIAPDKQVAELFAPFPAWANENIEEVILAEQTVIGRGYGGKMDLKCRLKGVGKVISDFKSRKSINGKFATYVQDDLQLASYQAADGDYDTTRVSIFIDSQEPREPVVKVWDRSGDDASFGAFMAAFEVWKYIKNYRPL